MWLADQLSRLDQFFTGFGGNRVAFAIALAVLVFSFVAFDRWSPLNSIRSCLGEELYVGTGTTFGYKADRPLRHARRVRGQGPGQQQNGRKGVRQAGFLQGAPLRHRPRHDPPYPLLDLDGRPHRGACPPLPHAARRKPAKVNDLTLVPLAAGLFDFVENLSLLFVINRHEADHTDKAYGLAAFSSAMTMGKLVWPARLLSAIVVGMLAALGAFVKARR